MNNKGFTLIEIAIGLVVVGLLTLPLVQIYKVQILEEKRTYNLGQFNNANNKINQFTIINSRYPRPSSLTAGVDDTLFGLEVDNSTAINPCTAWPVVKGVCRVTGQNVLIGGLPVKALGMDERAAFDLWGNKILYAVTESETVAYDANTDGFVFSRDIDTPAPGSPMDFLMVSFGQRGSGAYSQSGNLVSACPDDTIVREGENCDFDEQFIQRNIATNDFGIGIATSLVDDGNYYDDYTAQQVRVPLDLWNQSLAANTSASDYAITNANRIGIGTETPSAKVHVVGDVAADAILTANVCRNGGECFDPLIISGIVNEMNCDLNSIPGNEPVLWLANEQVYCALPADSAGNVLGDGSPNGGLEFVFPDNAVLGPGNGFGRINCADSGMLMTGIDTNGDPICAMVP